MRRMVVMGVAVAAACGGERSEPAEGTAYRREKNAAGVADSIRVAGLAREALVSRGQTDSLVVVSFTKGANGYLLKLAPASGPQDSGGSVWVDEDESVTVMQQYVP